ncbi:MAG: C_GCAxxG_C_C family protein [Firmicutes bacterium]|nr:C_GCAxxG_C_C family protein [Bacillota bacterium]
MEIKNEDFAFAEKAAERAEQEFKKGFNCAEATLKGVADTMELPPCPQGIATAFGGGIGRCGSLCSALTGAIMAISLSFNRTSPENKKEYALILDSTCRDV